MDDSVEMTDLFSGAATSRDSKVYAMYSWVPCRISGTCYW